MDAEKNGLGDDPHGAMFLVLAYLPLFELLAMSQVCKSLRYALNNDVWPWLKIFIVEKPLNSRLSDDSLLQITCKANGRLTTLALINCVKITDDGLLGAIAKNPLINKVRMNHDHQSRTYFDFFFLDKYILLLFRTKRPLLSYLVKEGILGTLHKALGF